MPRVSKEQAELHRATIMDAAARLFRERGIDGVSVADLMAAAGLTHGGFYGHFDSKDSLAAAACRLAFDGSIERWRQRVGAAHEHAAARTAIVDRYLSAEARSNPGTSCPASTLAGDAAREPMESAVRDNFAAGVDGLTGILATLQESHDAADARRRALADLSTMVGAQILARATLGREISDEILAAAREHLLGSQNIAAQDSSTTVRPKSSRVR
jgi:TetR/AcrR family transcriptional regulator, transcriptional repressor for nem operon